MKTLLATVPLACKALKDEKLAYWELGNEPDLFVDYPARPADWNEKSYVDEWLSKTRVIKRQLRKSCPDLVTGKELKYIAPSFAGLTNSLDPLKVWQVGLNDDHDIGLNSMHK